MILNTDEPSEKSELALAKEPPPAVGQNSGQSSTSPGCSHRCEHCNSGKVVEASAKPRRAHGRRLLCAATCLAAAIFVFATAELATECTFLSGIEATGILQSVVLWYAIGTVLTIALMLRRGRRKKVQNNKTSATSEVYVLCGLGLIWMGFTFGLVATNVEPCEFAEAGLELAVCALFTVVDVLAGLLWITILAAAFVMYRGTLIPEDVKSASPGGAQETGSER